MDKVPPPPSDLPHVRGLLGVDALMLTSTIVVVVITILSTFARRSGNRFLRIFLTVLSQLYIPLITYTISATDVIIKAPSPLLVVSAALLQVIFKKAIPRKTIEIDVRKNNIDVSNDNLVEQLTDLGWLGFLILNNDDKKEFKVPAGTVLLISLLKVVQGNLACRLANQSFSVGRNTKLVACYMEQLESEKKPEQAPQRLQYQPQSEFMSEYRYLVMGEEKQKRMLTATGYSITTNNTHDFITVDKIWACQGPLLNESNRELCLSFALCKLLRRRFEGLPLAESNTEKSLKLVLHGPFRNHQRAFQIIDAELALLNDYLYSPHPYTYYGWFPILNIIVCLLFLASNFYLGVRIHEKLINHKSYLYGYYHSLGQDLKLKRRYVIALLYLDGIVCLIILFVTGWMEVWEVITYLLCDHAKVMLLCKYVKNYGKPLVCRIIELLYTEHRILKLWSNKLRQYSICKDKMEKSIMVPDEVKKAIIRSLRNSRGKVFDGSASLNSNEVNISLAFDVCSLKSHSEKILIWHIATSHCEDSQSGFNDSAQRKAASSLSKYCAYLVVSVPELIPDYSAWTQFISDGVIKEIHPGDRGFRTWIRNLWCVRKRKVFEEGPSDRPAETVSMGRELGRLLVTEIGDEGLRWEVLAELWAEMMLYLSLSSDNVDAHAANMGRGGEFITHVWALLSHAGINHCIKVEVHS